MDINITLIEKSINSLVDEITEQITGELNSTITLQETIAKLGVISSLVIALRNQAQEAGLSEEALNRISDLRKTSDKKIEALFNKMLNIRGQIGI